MRKLSTKQKNHLEKTGAHHVMDIHEDVLVKIEAMNDYETFHQDAERFLNDNYFQNS